MEGDELCGCCGQDVLERPGKKCPICDSAGMEVCPCAGYCIAHCPCDECSNYRKMLIGYGKERLR